jgi:DNA-binding NarL/FixJ family response regulator
MDGHVDISPCTVHKHVGRIYTHLGVENRHAAMALVMDRVRRGR